MTDLAAGQPVAGPPAVTPAYRRYALSVLLIIYTLNFLDRQIVTILAEPIRNDLKLADWQLGMMTGMAFALLYTLLGIPIARYAERGNRSIIISISVALWSGFTVLCGMAQNFWQLLLARVGVGIGEAGCTPPAHSLITDYVPKEKRASALAFYSLGTPLGSLLGMVLGGLIADAYGWRTAFILAGAPGAIIALVTLFTLVEPRRRIAADIKAQQAKGPTFAQALAELAGKPTFWFISFGVAIVAFNGYGSGAFVASFFFRNHPADLAALAAQFGLQPLGFLGLALGLISGTAGMIGVWLGGFLAERFGGSDPKVHMMIPAVAGLIGLPFYILALLIDSGLAALLLFAVPTLLSSFWYGPVYGSVQGLVRPETRATAAAILLFIANLIGLGLGPLGTGILSDLLANQGGLGAAEGVRYSLLIWGLFGILGSWCFWMAGKTIRRDMVS